MSLTDADHSFITLLDHVDQLVENTKGSKWLPQDLSGRTIECFLVIDNIDIQGRVPL